MKFFTSANLLEVMYVFCGLVAIYVAVKSLLDKEHKSKYGSFVFWFALGLLFAFGKILSPLAAGILVVIMALPAMFSMVKPGNNPVAPAEFREKMASKYGNKLFIPAFSIGLFAIIFAIPQITKLGALVGLGAGALIAIIITYFMTKDTPVTMLREGKRMLEAVGDLSVLPQLLASLGAIFTAAGVGTVIANGVKVLVPQGNVFIGIVIYAVGMAVFTMIMGNAFAAFSVITVGIGVPFVLKYGLNPNIIGMLALTSGYCGTLMTPMAANFNVVPVAVLEMKDKYGVIKKQIPVALTMLVVQIIMMYFFAR